MSHITEVKMQILDLDALAEAATLLGGELKIGKKTHRTYGRFVGDSAEGQDFVDRRGAEAIGKCEHAIVLKNDDGHGYEVGLVPNLDGPGYKPVFDSWGPGQRLVSAFGEDLGKLKQEYAVAVAMKKAEPLKRKGFAISRENLTGGIVRLRLKKR